MVDLFDTNLDLAPYQRGSDDFHEGLEFDECPYDANSWPATAWLDGWLYAEDQTAEAFAA